MPNHQKFGVFTKEFGCPEKVKYVVVKFKNP